MDRYAFILGKNPGLSSAEIFSYLRKRGVSFNLQDHARGFLILDMDRPVSLGELGGTIKTGRVLSTFTGRDVPAESVEEAALLIPSRSLFGVSAYGSNWKDLASKIKTITSKKGMSSKFMNIPTGRSSLTHVEVIKRRLIEDSAEILLMSGKQTYLARTTEVHNPFEFQKRDMDRPFKRPMLSIPPRLCRIMINLSGQDGVLLDPFCGIGTILQEASLMGFRTWGIDTDPQAVTWARRNLKWVLKEYGIKQPGFDERIQKGDARKLPELFPRNSLDAIVTEPYLGQPLKRKPDLNKARRIIREVTPLYQRFIRGASEILKPGGRIVTVSPYFNPAGPGRPPIRLNMQGLAERSGLALINPLEGSGLKHDLPMTDSEDYHRTIREISVMEAPV